VCKKSRPHRDFFSSFCTIVDRFDHFDRFDLFDLLVVTNMGQIILLPLPKEGML
jgi:hypothetical protein